MHIVSWTGVRIGGALSQSRPKLDESSNNHQSQQEENCLIKLSIDFSWTLIFKFPWDQIAFSMINTPAFPNAPCSLSLSLPVTHIYRHTADSQPLTHSALLSNEDVNTQRPSISAWVLLQLLLQGVKCFPCQETSSRFPFVMYFSHLSQIWLGFALWPKFSLENTLAFLNPEHRPCINHGADDWWVGSMNQNKLLSSLYSAPPGLSRVHKGEKTSCTHPTGCKPGGLRQEGASQTYKGSHTVPRGTLGTRRGRVTWHALQLETNSKWTDMQKMVPEDPVSQQTSAFRTCYFGGKLVRVIRRENIHNHSLSKAPSLAQTLAHVYYHVGNPLLSQGGLSAR